MAHADRGFKSIGDVLKADGVLAMQKGLPYSEFLFKKHGQPKAKIVPYLGGVGNFLSDKKFSQQVFVTAEPIEAKRKGAQVTTFLVADEGYNPYTAVLATRASLLKKDPKLVKAMVEASREGWRSYLDRPETVNAFMATLNKAMDAEAFAESTRLQKPLIETAETAKSGLGTMTEERWRTLVDQLEVLKMIKKKPEAKTLFEKL
jgi:NitT/TauT family transport system substrate-binding protein